MTTSSKRFGLTRLLGATALTLSLALTGCGTSESASTSAEAPASEEEAAEETADDEVVLSDEITEATNVVKTIAQTGDTTGANQLDQMPALEDEQLGSVEGVTDLVEGEGEDAKAPSGQKRLVNCGVELLVPSTWEAANTSDGIVFLSPDGGVMGSIASYDKPAGSHYDLEGLAKAVPASSAERGFTDIQIGGYNTGYSASGTLCSAYVLYTGTYNGTQIAHYVQFVESKSYLNVIEMIGQVDDFRNNLEDINGIVNSVKFYGDEAI